MDIRRQFAIVRAWFPLVVVSVVLAGAAAFLITSQQPKVYEASATLIVGQSLSGVNPDYNQLLASQRLSTTYAKVATTRPILDNVAKKLGLGLTADELASHVSANAATDSALLTITARDGDPDRAAALANALANELISASPAVQGRQGDVQKSVDEDLKATQDQITATQSQVESLASLQNRTPAQEQELQSLQTRLISLRSTFATLLAFASSNASNLVTVIQPAVPDDSPVAPKPLLYALLGGFVGFLIASSIAFIAEYLDDTVKDPEEVQEVAGLPTLGWITRLKGSGGRLAILRLRRGKARSEFYRLVTLLYPRSAAAEAYGTLRANVEFAAVDAPIRTLLVASAIPREGKTVTAANLAVAFAQAGHRVLLVDADFRKPGVHVIFNLPNARGLTTLLRSDDAILEAIAQRTEQENLRVLTTGPLPPNPAELLGSQRMRTILDRLQAGYDLLIFDSPPLQVVSDAVVLSSFLDATLLMIDVGHSRRGAVRKGREALAKAGARVLGTVLNRLPGPIQSDYAYAEYDRSQEEIVKRAGKLRKSTREVNPLESISPSSEQVGEVQMEGRSTNPGAGITSGAVPTAPLAKPQPRGRSTIGVDPLEASDRGGASIAADAAIRDIEKGRAPWSGGD